MSAWYCSSDMTDVVTRSAGLSVWLAVCVSAGCNRSLVGYCSPAAAADVAVTLRFTRTVNHSQYIRLWCRRRLRPGRPLVSIAVADPENIIHPSLSLSALLSPFSIPSVPFHPFPSRVHYWDRYPYPIHPTEGSVERCNVCNVKRNR